MALPLLLAVLWFLAIAGWEGVPAPFPLAVGNGMFGKLLLRMNKLLIREKAQCKTFKEATHCKHYIQRRSG